MYNIRSFISGHKALSIIAGANIAIWLLLRLIMVFAPECASAIMRFCELPCNAMTMLHRPWTLVTYMWIHSHALHLLPNMLWLCYMGLKMPHGRGWSIQWLFMAGGICGGLLYSITGTEPNHTLIGSSAAVMAVSVAVTMVIPHRKVPLPIIGHVELMWLTTVIIAMDAASVVFGDSSGHIAHLGGAALGLLAGWQMKRWKFKPMTHPTRHNDTDLLTEHILAKVRRSGHSSLSPEERRVLFKISRGK